MLAKDEARRIPANIAKLAGAFAEAQCLARDYVRDRSIRDRRVMGLVSNDRSGGYDSDSNDEPWREPTDQELAELLTSADRRQHKLLKQAAEGKHQPSAKLPVQKTRRD